MQPRAFPHGGSGGVLTREVNTMITAAIVGAVASLLLFILAPPVLRSVARLCHYAADAISPKRRTGARGRLTAKKDEDR